MDFLKDFGVKPILLAAQVVNFLILLWILNKLLYRPILKVLAQRRKNVEDSLKNAEEIEQRLLQTEEDRDEKLAKAGEEAQKIIEEGKVLQAQMIEEGREKTAKLVESMIKEGEESIRRKEGIMQQQIYSNLSNIVILVLQKVTGKVISKGDQKRIVEQEIKNLS